MAHKYGSADKEVARIARGQKGVIKIGQLLDAGLSRNMVSDRVAKGTLHREYPGVYRVGHSAPSTEARYLAAVYASGDEARLSGFAAAYAYGVIKGKRPAPEVTTTANRRVRGAIVHRVRNLYPTDVGTYDGIPITTVARTLVDLAAHLPLAELSRTCHEAEVKHRTTATEVLETLARKPNAPGAAKLRAIYHGDHHLTLSPLEEQFLSLLREAGLPLPETNKNRDGRYIDCRWPAQHLTVELDSFTYHRTRHAWEQDRDREREARARGDEHRRYTSTDLTSGRAIAELTALLENPAGRLRRP